MSGSGGTLYVVATPIGNLADMTERARTTLADVAVVAAEDTRRTGRLLTTLNISTRLVSLHEHNESRRVRRLLGTLESGEDVALVSDAGTPLVSDPGYRLVSAARGAGIDVRAVPGCCAAIAALSIAGLPSDRFHFEGFLPSRAKARRTRLASLSGMDGTMVFFEAGSRLTKTIDDMVKLLGADRRASLAREMTKLHESSYTGSLDGIASRLRDGAIDSRGEFTLVVAGADHVDGVVDSDENDRWLAALLEYLNPSQSARVVASVTGEPRRALYDRALALNRLQK